MIALTRLNGHRITVNSDLIKYVEATPDTTLTLITGEKLIVLETSNEVAELSLNYRIDSLRRAWPESVMPLAASAAFQGGIALQQYEQQHQD